MVSIGDLSEARNVFSASEWMEKFTRATKQSLRKQMRIEIMEETLKTCENFGYTLPDGRRISLGDHSSISNEVRKTKLYVDQNPPKQRCKCKEGENVTAITVENRDCLDEAIRLMERGLYPVVLNMASPRRPGRLLYLKNFHTNI